MYVTDQYIHPDLNRKKFNKGWSMGIDEVGVSSIAGPMIASAYIPKPEHREDPAKMTARIDGREVLEEMRKVKVHPHGHVGTGTD